MVNKIFDYCISLLIEIGKLTHLSYKEVNVLIFCIIWPLFTLVLLLIIIKQSIKIKNLKKHIIEKSR